MKKRLMALLMVLAVICGCLRIVPASDDRDEQLMEIIGLLKEAADGASEADLKDLAAALQGMDMEEAAGVLASLEKLLESEEFRSLINHEEVLDLLLYVAERGADFVKDEPELTDEILVALGLSEENASVMQKLLASGILTSDLVLTLLSDEAGISLTEELRKAVLSGKVDEILNAILKFRRTASDIREKVAGLMSDAEYAESAADIMADAGYAESAADMVSDAEYAESAGDRSED